MPYDLIIVGTGFASSFFLREVLARADRTLRVLVLERGVERTLAWQIDNLGALGRAASETIDNHNPSKPWVFSIAFGGGSNCWWACTPRMLPSDFELYSRYGVGVDWPIGYDALEPYYTRAEEWMAVSGPSGHSPFVRSTPYPQEPHRWSTPDEALARAFGDQFFVQPTARARVSTSRRPGCCANATCATCPIDAKFRVPVEMAEVYADDRVEVRFEAEVERLEMVGTAATRVHFGGPAPGYAEGRLFVLGANAIFNAHILARSGHNHAELGRGLVEQTSVTATVDLEGMSGFDGSTSVTGHGYMLYDGPHRREHAAALIETMNVPHLRTEPGRWRDRLVLKFIYGDLRQPENRVVFDPTRPERPIIEWVGHSPYTERAVARLDEEITRLLAPLPVQRYSTMRNATESHVMGTVPMGHDPSTSVVDADLVDHRVRNVIVLGASAFPTAPPANPTLTLAALAIRSADRLIERGLA